MTPSVFLVHVLLTAAVESVTLGTEAWTVASPADALTFAATYLKERGYRSGPSARPNHIFVLGGREGNAPRVTAEIAAQGNVGKSKATMVTISGFGERLSPTLAELVTALRSQKPEPR